MPQYRAVCVIIFLYMNELRGFKTKTLRLQAEGFVYVVQNY
jgi:hypothetical protein